ncbi:MAG: hypothetical protein M1817_003873 [Caeruleum heppii]|nr:MAG: hypothetical protein M1817_003873 [Caeruleum heppii]
MSDQDKLEQQTQHIRELEQLIKVLEPLEKQALQAAHRIKELEHQKEQTAQAAQLELEHQKEQTAQAARAEKRLRRTTFEEYLIGHHQLSDKVSVQTNPLLSTKGLTTNPRRKLFPTYLRPWEGFTSQHQQIFDDVHASLNPSAASPPRLFSSTCFIDELGSTLSKRKLASEADLAGYQRIAVEYPVTEIISALVKQESERERLHLANGISFENHANTLSDLSLEVVDALNAQAERSSSTSSTKPVVPRGNIVRADQICVYQDTNGERQLRFVIEYKAPLKLSLEYLSRGLRPMTLEDEVINRITIPTDADAYLQYQADRVTAIAITQIFSYMIENGLEYGYITTGEAFVFLRVAEDDPTTVYYHLVDPSDARIQCGAEIQISRTAVGQALGFCLMALRSKPRPQQWRMQSASRLGRWDVSNDAILSQMPKSEGRSPSHSPYIDRKSRKRFIPQPPPPLRKRPCRQKVSCQSDGGGGGGHVSDKSSDHSNDEQGARKEAKEPKPGSDAPREWAGPITPRKGDNRSGHRQRQYCTHKCLLGVMRGTRRDETCSNAASHEPTSTGRHMVSGREFVRLIREQLARDLDNNCKPLGLQGARGALFKLTLASQGYTFVAKGTVRAFVPHLRHEGDMYKKLRKLQGKTIPVHLGGIDLVHYYYLDIGVRIQHMLLMSWAGEPVTELEMTSLMLREISRAVKEMLREGVEHHDVREPNVLWDPTRTRPMMIDFERSKVVKPAPASPSTCSKKGTGQGIKAKTGASRKTKDAAPPKKKAAPPQTKKAAPAKTMKATPSRVRAGKTKRTKRGVGQGK